jgi:hypothetical protein
MIDSGFEGRLEPKRLFARAVPNRTVFLGFRGSDELRVAYELPAIWVGFASEAVKSSMLTT